MQGRGRDRRGCLGCPSPRQAAAGKIAFGVPSHDLDRVRLARDNVAPGEIDGELRLFGIGIRLGSTGVGEELLAVDKDLDAADAAAATCEMKVSLSVVCGGRLKFDQGK